MVRLSAVSSWRSCKVGPLRYILRVLCGEYIDILRTGRYTCCMYRYEHTDWPCFTWDAEHLLPLLSEVRFTQGALLGVAEGLGFEVSLETEARAIANEVIASSKIEGVELDASKVRSSVSRQLGLDIPENFSNTHEVDGVVSVMFDAVKRYGDPLSHERLWGWHNALFPTGYSGLRKITVARYRHGLMSVVSGAIGREKIHFNAPDAPEVPLLMERFLTWFNEDESVEPLLKAGLTHLWFLTIHPFDDGNGRIARALTELLLARADRSSRRFYSTANFILANREDYYAELERAQKGTCDVTAWLSWFLGALQGSLEQSQGVIRGVLEREAFWSSIAGVVLNDRQQSMLARVKGGFEGKLTASKWAKICKVSPDTALRDINDLIEKGILARASGGGRSVSYVLCEMHDG